jgi:hypothetical protein
MRFLTYDSNGNFTGAYIQDTVPTGESYVEVDAATYANWVNLMYQNGAIVPRPAAVPPVPTEADYVAAVQGVLDTTAQQRSYDGILSACSYASSTNTKFASEAQACIAWRDACWTYCYATIPSAPTVSAMLAGLPVLTWPD